MNLGSSQPELSNDTTSLSCSYLAFTMCAAIECASSSSLLLSSFSTTPGKQPSGIAMDSSVTPVRSDDVLSRKRSAARRLSRITMNTVHPQIDEMSNDSTANEYSQDEDNGDSKRRLLASGIASDHLTLSELSDSQSKSPICCTGKGDLVKGHRLWPEVNNTIVCGYQLVGVGKEFTAYHTERKVVKTCQLIDSEQYKKLLTIAHRLDEAKNYWKYGDLETMREFVLPSSTEVCSDEKGRRFMFSNWHYGTLHSKVQAGKARLSESEVFSLFSMIVRGMAFCHACGIVVRDVKLRKFVFTDKQMTELRLRDIFDVFVCEDVNNDQLRDRHSCPAYVAPEILKDSAEYAGRPADIWALGVLLYVLLFGSYPFNDATPQRLFFRILKAKFSIPTHIPVSQTARALIFGLLRKEPLERPTAEELLNISLIDQTLDESNIMSFRSILPSWLEITSSRIVSVLDVVSTPALEFARHIMRANNENDDQVVPLISSSTRNIQRQLQIMRTVIADTSFTTTVSEASSDDSLSSISDFTSSSGSVDTSPSANSVLEAASVVYL